MILKIVTFFLIGIAVLGMFGRLRWPGGQTRIGKKDPRPAKPGKCRKCGAYIIGDGPCPCEKG